MQLLYLFHGVLLRHLRLNLLRSYRLMTQHHFFIEGLFYLIWWSIILALHKQILIPPFILEVPCESNFNLRVFLREWGLRLNDWIIRLSLFQLAYILFILLHLQKQLTRFNILMLNDGSIRVVWRSVYVVYGLNLLLRELLWIWVSLKVLLRVYVTHRPFAWVLHALFCALWRVNLTLLDEA